MDCDIIGFQEVFSQDALKKLCLEMGFEYFEVVDTPKLLNPTTKIYVSTTVAIASKYPIEKLYKVKVHPKALNQHFFKGHFEFSRIPIKARIKIGEDKEVMTYVVHFKSNRLNEFEYLFTKEDGLAHKVTTTYTALKNGMSPALKQRLCEASCLYHDIKKVKLPVVVMGDFNDKEFSLTHDALSNKNYNELKTKGFVLNDASKFYKVKERNPHPEAKEKGRTPTSYYQGKGNVLDYIFISNQTIKVKKYETFDAHLQENREGSLLQSDHAQVVCEINI